MSILHSGFILVSYTFGSYVGLYSTQWLYACLLHFRVLLLVSILHRGFMLASYTLGPYVWILFYPLGLRLSVTL